MTTKTLPRTRTAVLIPNTICCPTCGFAARYTKAANTREIEVRCYNQSCADHNIPWTGLLPTVNLETKE